MMMMRFLGNTVAKSCRSGRLQYRDFSSSSASGTSNISKKIVEYCFKGAFCGVGYVFGGLISSPVAKKVQETEEMLLTRKQDMDDWEASLME